MWTLERVKEDLPDVPVMIGEGKKSKTYIGHVRGRQLDFPTVWWRDEHGGMMSAEFAWQTILHALSNGNSLRV